MANYILAQINFGAAQEAGLDRKLSIHNAGRAASGLPAQNKQQYLDSLAQAWPVQFISEFRDDFKERCSLAMQTASVATLQTVATALGVDINPYD